MICLDTNVLIGVLNGRPHVLKARFDAAAMAGTLFLSVICLFELEFGIAKSSQPAKSAERLLALLQTPLVVLPFEQEDSREAAAIRASLARAGTPIGPYDLLIAAQALRRGATLVTANTREFARVPGLVLQDWTAG